jgi:hypothetical protein
MIVFPFSLPVAAGEETFTITYTNDVPYVKAVDLGEKRVARIAEHILIARNDAGKGFMHNTAASCIVMFVEDPPKPRQGNGYCTYRDEEGDSIFEHYDYSTASTGKVTVVGGTGKYAGVSCSGEWKKLATPKSPVEGKWQNIGSKTIKCNMP